MKLSTFSLIFLVVFVAYMAVMYTVVSSALQWYGVKGL
tara:strand:+ start:172 stop:285 length:114 start_codon:yes stop_codon:yes gene_type:complete